MTTLLLIRHGAFDFVGKLIAGRSFEVHLNAEGRSQAQRLAGRLANLRIAALYSSPLTRALETAAPLAQQLGVEVLVREALNEIQFAEWTGSTVADLAGSPEWQAFNRLRSLTRIPRGELMLEVQCRFISEIDALRGHHRDDTIALVSHGDVIRAGIAHFLGMPLDLLQRFDISPASVSVVTLEDHGPRVVRLNDTGDLV